MRQEAGWRTRKKFQCAIFRDSFASLVTSDIKPDTPKINQNTEKLNKITFYFFLHNINALDCRILCATSISSNSMLRMCNI